MAHGVVGDGDGDPMMSRTEERLLALRILMIQPHPKDLQIKEPKWPAVADATGTP